MGWHKAGSLRPVHRAWLIGLSLVTFALSGAHTPQATVFAGAPAALRLQAGTVTHAAFFSAETGQPTVIDPQAFLPDATASAVTGPQNVSRVAGLRPARPGSDAPSADLLTADATPLGVTVEAWFSASGVVTVTCTGPTAIVDTAYQGLIPGGLYQLERIQFLPAGAQRGPLAATSSDPDTSAAVAASDGSLLLSIVLDYCPLTAGDEVIALAYHSDGQLHGQLLGEFGHTLHNQLISDLRPLQ